MRILVLGGTQFLGRAIAADAVARGHQVTCAARGITGAVPPGARLVPIDREAPNGLAALDQETFDAVVDVGRHPGQVRRAVAALRPRAGHWTFVSTVSVYADNSIPNQTPTTATMLAPSAPEVEYSTSENYGPTKVACEQAVGEGAFLCRPGLIVGPEDPTGRFTYWPLRLARGGETLAGVSPTDMVQVIDVRDLAAWIIHAAETNLTGAIDAVGLPIPTGQFLADIASGIGAKPHLTWADRAFLEAQEVRRWAGPRSLPLWLPQPENAGFLTRSAQPALAAGLTLRPLSETAQDTLAWAQAPNAPPTGLTAEEEAAILAAWHARPAPKAVPLP
jgi:nucleoside-diphosphate-sugar epimerase